MGAVHLYLDRRTLQIFEEEARSKGLSISRFLRVFGRVLREPVHWSMTIQEFRARIDDIIEEERRNA